MASTSHLSPTTHRHRSRDPKIALVCDWITNPGGDEKVIWALHNLFPKAPIFTTVYNAAKMPQYKNADIRTTNLQKLPLAKSHHQFFVPLMFGALRSHDLDKYDIIISSSHTVGKSITKPKNAIHVCYCHTPLRYIWAPEIDDIRQRIPLGPLTQPLLRFLKQRDLDSARGVNIFIANSKTIARRIKYAYGAESIVINPPIDTGAYKPKYRIKKENYYLTASRLIPYKKIDLIVRAFNKLGKKLLVVGTGPEQSRLKNIAQSNIKLLGFVPEKKFIKLLQYAQAFIFAANEDFGIVPVEAMAAGTPVIAYNSGGATETVINNKTGLFFKHQTTESIVEAVKKFEKKSLQSDNCIKQARKFDCRVFDKKILELLNLVIVNRFAHS